MGVNIAAEDKSNCIVRLRADVIQGFTDLDAAPSDNIKHIDLRRERVKKSLAKMGREDQGFLNYLYNPNTDKFKPWAFVRVWVDCHQIVSKQPDAAKFIAADLLHGMLSSIRGNMAKLNEDNWWPTIPDIGDDLFSKSYREIVDAFRDSIVTIDSHLLRSL